MTDDERGRGILSAADREFLRSDPEEYSRQARHGREDAIADRVRNAILDFSLLFEHTDREDRERIYEELPDGTRGTGGLIAAMSFLYESMLSGGRGPFNALVELGVRQVVRQSLDRDREDGAPGVSVNAGPLEINVQSATDPDMRDVIGKLDQGTPVKDLADSEKLALLDWYRRADEFDPKIALREQDRFAELLDGPDPEESQESTTVIADSPKEERLTKFDPEDENDTEE